MSKDIKPLCLRCGKVFSPKRHAIGKKTCLPCGDQVAVEERSSWCVAPMHKSNYMLMTSREDLQGINNKGGLVR
jgi:hypothetical protein